MEPQPVRVINIAKQQTTIYFKIMKLSYQILSLLLCLDFGFFEYKTKKQKIIRKIILVVQSSILCCVCMFTLDNEGHFYITIWFAMYLAHYYLSVIVLVLTAPDKKISNFHFDLKLIDLKMRVETASYNLEKYLLITFLLVLSFRVVMCVVNCVIEQMCFEPTSILAVYLALIWSLDIVYVTYAFVFYAINCRLKKLTCILSANANITLIQHTYKQIIELAVKYKTAFDPMLIIALLFTTPEVMVDIYWTVQQFIQGNLSVASLKFRSDYLVNAEILALTLAPAILAGMLSTHAERIKIILHNKLMKERDETKIYEIERCIHYVEAHPCRFRVCKVIPLDANLLLMVLNFCVTYLIVIIQFTTKS